MKGYGDCFGKRKVRVPDSVLRDRWSFGRFCSARNIEVLYSVHKVKLCRYIQELK